MTGMQAPTPDPLVDALFREIMMPPPGYSYHPAEGQLLFPVFGQDRWRLLLRKGEIPPYLPSTTDMMELVPVFIEGSFILKLTKALNAMQRELNQAVSDDMGEPNRARVS